MRVLLRAARMQDVPALGDLLAQLGYPDTSGFLDARVRQLLAHPDAELTVAETEGVVLGFIALHFLPQLARAGDFCRITYFCVAARARSLGIGAQLEAWALQQARSRGCERIELHSHQRRVDAHRFYFRQGYEESPKYLAKALAATARGHGPGE